MSVIGPLDKKKAQGEDGGQLCSVVSKDDADASLHVMRPTGKDEWRKEDVANAVVEHYVPPNCVLATVPKPHGFQALHNKPNPNTKLDFFIEDQRVDLTSNLWSSHDSEPSMCSRFSDRATRSPSSRSRPNPRLASAWSRRRSTSSAVRSSRWRAGAF